MPKVVVAQGLCCPSRDLVALTAKRRLDKYGFELNKSLFNPLGVWARQTDTCWEITCDFSAESIEWGLYVLMRYNYQFVRADLPEHTINRTVSSAQRYLGAAFYEEGCAKKPKGRHPNLLTGANPPPAWQDQPRQPGRGKPRRATAKQHKAGWLSWLEELLP